MRLIISMYVEQVGRLIAIICISIVTKTGVIVLTYCVAKFSNMHTVWPENFDGEFILMV